MNKGVTAMKRVCALLLSLILLLAFTSCSLFKPETNPPGGNGNVTPSGPTADNSIYCDPITAAAGQEISVPVSIKNNKGICGFEIIVTYDASILTRAEDLYHGAH